MNKEALPKRSKRTESIPPAATKRGRANGTIAAPPLDRAELKSFLALKHGNPHGILGAHEVEGGIVIPAFLPDAENIEVVTGRKKPQPMTKIHDSGLFEVVLPGLKKIPSYRLK